MTVRVGSAKPGDCPLRIWVNFTRAGKDFPTGNVTLFSDVNLGPTRTRNECHKRP